jgi:hypothetical protein
MVGLRGVSVHPHVLQDLALFGASVVLTDAEVLLVQGAWHSRLRAEDPLHRGVAPSVVQTVPCSARQGNGLTHVMRGVSLKKDAQLLPPHCVVPLQGTKPMMRSFRHQLQLDVVRRAEVSEPLAHVCPGHVRSQHPYRAKGVDPALD